MLRFDSAGLAGVRERVVSAQPGRTRGGSYRGVKSARDRGCPRWRAFWGLLFGIVFFIPVFVGAIGATIAALGAHFNGYGISDDDAPAYHERE
jgi:hypothetical protein